MDELEYKKRYKARLIEHWGMDKDLAQETADVAEFDPSDPDPENHADDCASYMAEDA